MRLHNPTQRVAFFERVEVSSARDADEILPIEYSDNYVTVFPGETVDVDAVDPDERRERPLGESHRIQHTAHRRSGQLTAAKLTVAVAPTSSSLPR